MDEGRKRVIGIMAAILASLHMRTADDLFGRPQGSPQTDNLIAASVQWAERIMKKIDECLAVKNESNRHSKHSKVMGTATQNLGCFSGGVLLQT